MAATPALASADLVAHGIHYGVLAAGLVGLTLLLAPQLLESRREQERPPRDEHERRVRELRAELSDPTASYAAGAGATTLLTRAPASARHQVSRERSVLLPLAVVGSVAAAVVHAAVCPDHFRERTLFGVFFAVAALAQVGWAYLAARGASRELLALGALGNALVIGLWTVTRVEGLPFGLLPEPEAVGPWDVAAGAFELLVLITCLVLVRTGVRSLRMAPWRQWHRGVQALTVVAALTLVALSLSGAGA